jgi:hypothetical protein
MTTVKLLLACVIVAVLGGCVAELPSGDTSYRERGRDTSD